MKSILQLLRLLVPYRGYIALNVLCNVLAASLNVVSITAVYPFLRLLFGMESLVTTPPTQIQWWNAKQLFESLNYLLSKLVLEHGKHQALLLVCIGVVGVFMLKNMFRYLSLFFILPALQGVVRDLRIALYHKLLELPLGFYATARKGDLMARLTADMNEVESALLNVLEALVREPVTISLALVGILTISPTLSGFVFAMFVVAGVFIGLIGRTLRRQSLATQNSFGVLLAHLDESLGGLRIVKGFHAEAYQLRKFTELTNRHRRLLMGNVRRRDLASPITETLGIGVMALILWYGAGLVFEGSMDGGLLITYVMMFYTVIDPAKSLASAANSINKGMGALRRIEEVLHTPDALPEHPEAIEVDGLTSGIRLEGVTFRYQPNAPAVLQGIDLNIPKGYTVALVGASGAGKSTLADLLCRFYEVSEGRIEIDGTDVRQLSTRSLRRLIGLVSQEPVLFNDTVAENIRFGREASDEQVRQAAIVANAHEFIEQLPQGYDTPIGDRGGRLSGGQRQRLTIARAVLLSPPVLVLDEATASLDTASELAVQQALQQVMQHRTAVVIAHRLSTIRHANLIVVLHEGRIVEQGTHDELMRHAGTYSKLVAVQGLHA